MKRNNRSRNNRNKRRGRRRGPTQVVMSRRDPSFPPQVKVKPVYNRVLRYTATSAVNDISITRRCLLNLVLAGTNASTTAVNVHEAVKLDRICIYAVPDSSAGFGSSTADISITWGGDRGPDIRFTARGTVSHPACVKQKPPLNSLAGFWSTIYSDMDEPLCILTLPANGIVDIYISCCMGDGAGKTCVIVDPGLSGIVYAALDNAIIAGTVGGEVMRADALTYADMTTP